MYLKLRKDPEVVFLNTAQKLGEIIIVTWRILTFFILCVVTRFTRGSLDEQEARETSPFYLWFRFVDVCLFYILLFIVGQRWFNDCLSMREAIATYDVRNAKLTTETDRLLLLRFINYHWGDEHNLETGLDEFNEHIRNNVHRSLPVRGPRSWKLMSYFAAVLMLTPAALVEYDAWAYHAIWVDEVDLSVDPTAFSPIDFSHRPDGVYRYNPADFSRAVRHGLNRQPVEIPMVSNDPRSAELRDYAGLKVTHYNIGDGWVHIDTPEQFLAGCAEGWNEGLENYEHRCTSIKVSLCSTDNKHVHNSAHTAQFMNQYGMYASTSPLTGEHYEWYANLGIDKQEDKLKKNLKSISGA